MEQNKNCKIVSNVSFSVKPSQASSRDPRRCSVMTIWFACNASAIIMAKGDQLSSMPDGHPRWMASIQSTNLPSPLAPICTPPFPSALWLFCINVIIVAAVAQQQAGDWREATGGSRQESESRVKSRESGPDTISNWLTVELKSLATFLLIWFVVAALSSCARYAKIAENISGHSTSRVSSVSCFPV